MKKCCVVDSSGWLEFFGDTERAGLFAPAILKPGRLVVPVITIYEVYKRTLRDFGEEHACHTAATMQEGRVVELDISLALNAAANGLPLADSIIYATALRHGCELWTQDAHFENLPHVRYFAKDPR